MKVLHVINSLRPGGAEINVERLALHCERARVQPHVAYCGSWAAEARLKEAGVPTLRLTAESQRVRSLASPWIVARLAHYIRRHGIDIVHTHLFNAHVWGSVAAAMARAKVVEHVHDHRYTDRELLAHRSMAELRQYQRASYFARLSDHIVVLTNQNRQLVTEEIGIAARKVSVIPNGLPRRASVPATSERAALRSALGIPVDAFVLLSAGRLFSEKNFPMLIAAVAQLRGAVPNIFCVVVGEGTERPALETQIAQAGIDAVFRLPGHSSDVQSYYDSADVFVQPSLFELQSLAMMEAMQSGLPVVVSRGVGCNDNFIEHGQTGLLADPRQLSEWIEVIRMLAAQPELRVRLGLAGQELMNTQYDFGVVAERFEKLYASL
jgi:glycosyltransferase involved in cell wall biosynthesis